MAETTKAVALIFAEDAKDKARRLQRAISRGNLMLQTNTDESLELERMDFIVLVCSSRCKTLVDNGKNDTFAVGDFQAWFKGNEILHLRRIEKLILVSFNGDKRSEIVPQVFEKVPLERHIHLSVAEIPKDGKDKILRIINAS